MTVYLLTYYNCYQQILLQTRREHCEASKVIREVIGETENNGPFDTDAAIVLQMCIPNLPPSFLQYCRLIDIDYAIKFVIAVSGW